MDFSIKESYNKGRNQLMQKYGAEKHKSGILEKLLIVTKTRLKIEKGLSIENFIDSSKVI